jgi:hypothetical protein
VKVDGGADRDQGVGPGCGGRAQHGAEVARLFDTLSYHQQRIRAGRRQIGHTGVLLGEDREHALGALAVGGTVEGGGGDGDCGSRGLEGEIGLHEGDPGDPSGFQGPGVEPFALDHEDTLGVAVSPVAQTHQPLDSLVARGADVDGHQGSIASPSVSSPMDLVQLGSYNSKTEAELVKARLASAGIDAIVQADDLGSTTPMLGGFRGVLVLVREVDRVDALEVLERMLPGGES